MRDAKAMQSAPRLYMCIGGALHPAHTTLECVFQAPQPRHVTTPVVPLLSIPGVVECAKMNAIIDMALTFAAQPMVPVVCVGVGVFILGVLAITRDSD